MTGISSPRYVPILKGKRGEFDALRDLQPSTRSVVYPLVEILPSPEEQDVDADVDKAMNALATRWYEEPTMLDVGYFDLESDNGRTALGVAMDAAVGRLAHAVPVFRLADPAPVRADVARAAERDRHGAAIRLIGEDLDLFPEELNDELSLALSNIALSYSEVDLLFDLGAVSGDVAVLGGARLVVSLLRDLEGLPHYRSVTVASGAFPVDLSNVAPWTLGEHPRDDAALYNRILRRPSSRTIDYGDYAIAHPLLSGTVPFSPPPQLRYTVADRWLTLKARRNDPRGNAQFFDVCAAIAAHPDFVGADLGPADLRIASGPAEGYGPGNATTWRTIGTIHHADLVVSRLTNLGEP
jgi:hypothetical protein